MLLSGVISKVHSSNIYPYEVSINGNNHLVKSIDVDVPGIIKELEVGTKVKVYVEIINETENALFVKCLSGVGFWVNKR